MWPVTALPSVWTEASAPSVGQSKQPATLPTPACASTPRHVGQDAVGSVGVAPTETPRSWDAAARGVRKARATRRRAAVRMHAPQRGRRGRRFRCLLRAEAGLEALAGAELDLRAGGLGLRDVLLAREGVLGLLAALLRGLHGLGEDAHAGDGDAVVLLEEHRDAVEGRLDALAGLLGREAGLLRDVLGDVGGLGGLGGSHEWDSPDARTRPSRLNPTPMRRRRGFCAVFARPGSNKS